MDDLNSFALRVEQVIILNQLVPPRELPVGPYLKAEEIFRRRNLLGKPAGRENEDDGKKESGKQGYETLGTHVTLPDWWPLMGTA